MANRKPIAYAVVKWLDMREEVYEVKPIYDAEHRLPIEISEGKHLITIYRNREDAEEFVRRIRYRKYVEFIL